MTRLAFKMKLNPGCEVEYNKRHHEIWPELEDLLKGAGISEYSIFLDPATNHLFCVLRVVAPSDVEALASHPLMRKWWAYMADIMETNADHSPVITPLQEVFYMP
jgi:L-rhamnose mutarotase